MGVNRVCDSCGVDLNTIAYMSIDKIELRNSSDKYGVSPTPLRYKDFCTKACMMNWLQKKA